MGNGRVKVTKMGWYEENNAKVILFKDLTKGEEKADSIYYYLNEDGERKYVLNSDVKKQFLEKKKSRTINSFTETHVLKFPKAFIVTETGEFEKLEEVDEIPEQLCRKFSKRSYADKNKIYKNECSITEDDGKSPIYFKMIEGENKLVRNRCEAVKAINNAYSILVGDVFEQIKTNSKPDVIIPDHEFNKFYTELKKFTLNSSCEDSNIICLKDKDSTKKDVLETLKINSILGDLIIKNLELTDGEKKIKNLEIYENLRKDELKKEFENFYTTKNILINSTLGISYSNKKESTSKAKGYQVTNKNVRNNVVKYLNEYNYNGLLDELKKLFDDEKKKPIISKYNKEVILFNEIKTHYKKNYEDNEYDFDCSERAYYTKHIHSYILGRACKVRKKALSGEYKTYNDCKGLFDTNTITNKITRKIVNKSMLRDVTKGKLDYYALNEDNAEISKQLINMIETFNKKLDSLTYNAVVTGISEYKELNEIFSAGNAETFDKSLELAVKSDFNKYRTSDSSFNQNKKIYLKGAYFLRNYTLHKQKLGVKSDDNKAKVDFIEEINKLLCTEYDSKVKDKLVAYELDKLKYNNVFKYIEEGDINIVLDNIDINNIKPSYLPRFSRVYKQLEIENYKIEGVEAEKEYALFYLIKLLYEFGFGQQIKKEYVINRINAQIKTLKEDENIKILENAKLAVEKGLYEYKQDEIISKNGDADKISRFEKFYTKVVAKLFEIVLKELKLDKKLLLGNTIENTEEIEENIKAKLDKIIKVEKFQTNNLFIGSVYATAMLGDISTMSALKQAVDRYITLFTSLKEKYKSYNEEFKNISKKILEKEGVLVSSEANTDIIAELEKLQNQLNIEVKLYDYENIKLKDGCIKEDLKEDIIRIFNTSKSHKYSELENIKYEKQDKNGSYVPVPLWESGKHERGSNRIINSKFIILEDNQRTLKYLVDSHIYAMKTAGLEYDSIFEEIKIFNAKPCKQQLFSKETYDILNINDSDALESKNYIEYLMSIKNKIFEYYKGNEGETNKDNKNKLFNSLLKINDEVNIYNFYFRLITLTQLQINKKFLQSLNVRYFAWLYQGEKTATYLFSNEGKIDCYDKKKKFQKLGEYVKFIDENEDHVKEYDDFSRDEVAHLNFVQTWHQNMNDYKKSPREIYESFNIFNEYETKKLNEVKKIKIKMMEKYNIVINGSEFIPKTKIINAVKKDMPNISKQEAKYMKAIYNFKREKDNAN